MIVGLEAGGTVDTFARTFSGYLRKHIPGNPTILVQNMPGAGGKTATNHVFERAAPDGLTMLYGPWDPLAQALGDQGLRARYEKFEFLGGTGDIRVLYARRDAVPGGIKTPADIVKAENVALGALNNTDISGLLPHLALRVLGRQAQAGRRLSRRQRRVPGDAARRGQRALDQHHDLPRPQRRVREIGRRHRHRLSGAGRCATGATRPASSSPRCRRSPISTSRCAATMPSGAMWDALNWLTNQTGELTFVGLAPPATPAGPLAILRKAYDAASNDPEFIEESTKRYGMPYTYIDVERGRGVFRSLADVQPRRADDAAGGDRGAELRVT